MQRELMFVVSLVSALACVNRVPAALAPTSSKSTVIVETPAADEPPDLEPVEGPVKGEIGILQGDQCSIDSVGAAFPLVVADGSEVVLMARYDTYYEDGSDVLLQGLWRVGTGRSGVYSDRNMKDEAIQLIDWQGVDASTCDAAKTIAESAVANANAYLASKPWLAMEELEYFRHTTDTDLGPDYSCAVGTRLNLCASADGFRGVLLDPEWINDDDTWLYVSFSTHVAVAVQYQRGTDWYELTAAEVFDISEIVHALPPDYLEQDAVSDQR